VSAGDQNQQISGLYIDSRKAVKGAIVQGEDINENSKSGS
jgi:hypothetical protein